MIKLSVILVNHNARQLTLDCLASIAAKTRTPHEIILVDNASADGSVEAVRRRFPQAVIIANQANNGFARANNQGMEIARGKYVILLNNDTVLKNDALDQMGAFLEANPRAGALTCKLYDADGVTVQKNCRSFPSLLGTMFGRASLLTRFFPRNPWSSRNLLTDWDYNSARAVDWISGAALMVRREVIERVGRLDDKTYYMYWEDTDWCKRIRDAGWEICFTPAGEIVHLTGQGAGKRPLRLRLAMIYHLHRSAYRYFRKHYYQNPFHPLAVLAFVGMWSLVALKSWLEISKSFGS